MSFDPKTCFRAIDYCPEIWDDEDPRFGNDVLKRNSWDKLCRSCILEYSSMDKEEKDIFGKYLLHILIY